MTMENQEQITFIYVPINDKPPLAILVAEHEEILVRDIKKMLLKSLDKEKVSTSRIPLAKTSQDQKYNLLGDFELITGIKALDKFVYAFELSDSSHTYMCMLCRKNCDCELKKHVGSNCLFIMCNFCANNYLKGHEEDYECPVCSASVSMLSFITIGESVPAISVLNVPLVIDRLNIDMTVNELCTNFGEPRLIKLPFRVNDDENLPPTGDYIVHFVYLGDHDCTQQQCFFQNGSRVCDPTAPEKEILNENLISDTNDNIIQKIEPSIDKPDFLNQILITCDVSQVVNQSNQTTKTQNFRNLLADINDKKIPKIELTIDKTNFQDQIPISHDVLQVINQSNQSTNTQNSGNVFEINNDKKIQKIEPSINKTTFKKQIPISRDISQVVDQSNPSTNAQYSRNLIEEAKLENLLKIFQQHRDKTLHFFKESSRKIVNEGLQNLAEESERYGRSFGKNRPSRINNPFQNLKFCGRKDVMHPMRFVNDFEFFAIREKLNDYEQQFFFGQTLKDEAATWLKIRGYGRTFPEMKESFLNFFWNQDDQNRLLNVLKRGKYSKNSGLSMFEYFYKYACEANYLDKVPNEETLTEWLGGHFDIMVQAKLYGNHVKNINEALLGLKSLETSDTNGNLETPKSTQKPINFEKFSNFGNSNISEKPLTDEKHKNSDKPKDFENEEPNNFFSFSSTKKVKIGVWEDCFGFKYDKIEKDGELFHKCITEKIWPLHSLSYNNSQSDIQHFDVSCHEASSRFLINIPAKLYNIHIDINGDRVSYHVLGPITIAKQNGNRLIVSTSSSFKSYKNLVSGQLFYFQNESDNSFKPCGVITCSIPENSEFRYVISNANEQIVCLKCKDKIEEVTFRERRMVAIEELGVCYFEQSFKKKRHILRFLNQTFCTVYTVWDYAMKEYNPLKPTYH